MDSGGTKQNTAVVRPENMQARASDASSYWENYQNFQRNITDEKDTALARIEQQRRFGTLAPQAYENAKAALEASATKSLEELKTGPTYQLLSDEYNAQKGYALEQYNAAGPQELRSEAQYKEGQDGGRPAPEGSGPGSWQFMEDASDAGGNDVWVPAQESASPARDPFAFAASPEEYFASISAPKAGSNTANAAKVKAKATGGKSSSIGVGQVYNWY